MWVLFITTLANFLLFEIGSKQKVTPQNTCIRMLNSYSKNIANILLFFAQIIFKNTFKTSLRLLCHFTHAQIFIHIIVRYLLDILNVIFSHLVLFFPLIPFCWVQTQGLIPKTSFPHLLSISISLAFAGSSTFKTFFSNSSALYLLQTHYCFSSALLHYPLPSLKASVVTATIWTKLGVSSLLVLEVIASLGDHVEENVPSVQLEE